jgi:hypothetical protein
LFRRSPAKSLQESGKVRQRESPVFMQKLNCRINT